MESFQAEFIKIMVPAIGTALSLLTTWALFELRKFIRTKTDNQAAEQAFDVLANLIQTTVVSINQTVKRDLDENGKLNPDLAMSLKHKAKSIVLNQLHSGTKKILDKNIHDLSVFVDDKIEEAVHFQKLAKKAYG